ncbi:MAG: polysaccharide biosynthesis/export family protein [Verrucomicrobiota bacterium]
MTGNFRHLWLLIWALSSVAFAQDSRTTLMNRMLDRKETTSLPEPKAPPSENAETVSSAGAVASTNSMDALDSKRKLVIGDRVSYRVVEDRSDVEHLLVTDSGEMEVPLIGRVKAAGKACREVAEDIKKALEKDYFLPGHATVIIGLDSVSTRSRGSIYIIGQVRSPGYMDIPSDIKFTVSKAILRAGGFTDFANQHKVKLVRKSEKTAETTLVDVGEILKGRVLEDPVPQPDDMIIVSDKWISF